MTTTVAFPDDDPRKNRLRWNRLNRRLTQEEIAHELGVSLSTYQRWERGEQTPHLRTQRRIAKFYRLRTVDLLVWFPAVDGDGPGHADGGNRR